jgi:hypothetical protein
VGLCIAAGTAGIVLAAQAFTLSWTHSVEKTGWQESWRVTDAGLVLSEARVQGSGAGMEPPPDAVRQGRWYVYRPDAAPLDSLRLAVSGATGSGWRLCADGDCLVLDDLLPAGTAAAPVPPGEVVLRPCDPSVAGR